jgi:hypothetical protein
MLSAGAAKQLNIYVTEHDHYHHEPLYLALLDRARREGLAGVTVYHAAGGLGAHGRLHAGLNELALADLPLVVQVVDGEVAIAAFARIAREMAPEALMTLCDVKVL